jgi:hypothetical protein
MNPQRVLIAALRRISPLRTRCGFSASSHSSGRRVGPPNGSPPDPLGQDVE